MKKYLKVEDLEVYEKLCRLHIEICDLSYEWPPHERYELGSQVRRSSNSSSSQLAEKNDDRHLRIKSKGSIEAAERHQRPSTTFTSQN